MATDTPGCTCEEWGAAPACGARVGEQANTASPNAVRKPQGTKRSRRIGAYFISALVIAACAAKEPETNLGRSWHHDQDRGNAPQPAADPVPRHPPALFVQAQALERVGPADLVTSNHGAVALKLEIRTDTQTRPAYERWTPASAPLADGALIAAFHHAGDEPGEVFLMHKAHGQWQFHRFSAAGAALPVDEPLCQRCHAEAGADFVFGLGALTTPKDAPLPR